MDDHAVVSYTRWGDMSWCRCKKPLLLCLFSLFLSLTSARVIAAMKWSGSGYWCDWKLIWRGKFSFDPCQFPSWVHCMSVRMHPMTKAWMGEVAENSSRAGWRLSVVLPASPAKGSVKLRLQAWRERETIDLTCWSFFSTINFLLRWKEYCSAAGRSRCSTAIHLGTPRTHCWARKKLCCFVLLSWRCSCVCYELFFYRL